VAVRCNLGSHKYSLFQYVYRFLCPAGLGEDQAKQLKNVCVTWLLCTHAVQSLLSFEVLACGDELLDFGW
jgi:hypothetical protein